MLRKGHQCFGFNSRNSSKNTVIGHKVINYFTYPKITWIQTRRAMNLYYAQRRTHKKIRYTHNPTRLTNVGFYIKGICEDPASICKCSVILPGGSEFRNRLQDIFFLKNDLFRMRSFVLLDTSIGMTNKSFH